jgi:hypothetical protein
MYLEITLKDGQKTKSDKINIFIQEQTNNEECGPLIDSDVKGVCRNICESGELDITNKLASDGTKCSSGNCCAKP